MRNATPFLPDFANTKEEIFEAFQPYYERTDVDEITDPNLVHDLKTTLDGHRIYTESEDKAFAKNFLGVCKANRAGLWKTQSSS